MYIVVGLGNPGKEYENTRHNIGFMAIDKLSEKLNISVEKNKHKALIGKDTVNQETVMLVKPQTFMNLSGESVIDILNFYKEKPEKVIVIVDDIDLPLGKVRIKRKGSAGTHNGLKSIVSCTNSQDFIRVKVGVGQNRDIDLVNFVLGGFSKEEKVIIDEAIDKVCDAVLMITEGNINKAMNEFN
jgi:PTH1 family peptidyl-tRNA hydrolase